MTKNMVACCAILAGLIAVGRLTDQRWGHEWSSEESTSVLFSDSPITTVSYFEVESKLEQTPSESEESEVDILYSDHFLNSFPKSDSNNHFVSSKLPVVSVDTTSSTTACSTQSYETTCVETETEVLSVKGDEETEPVCSVVSGPDNTDPVCTIGEQCDFPDEFFSVVPTGESTSDIATTCSVMKQTTTGDTTMPEECTSDPVSAKTTGEGAAECSVKKTALGGDTTMPDECKPDVPMISAKKTVEGKDVWTPCSALSGATDKPEAPSCSVDNNTDNGGEKVSCSTKAANGGSTTECSVGKSPSDADYVKCSVNMDEITPPPDPTKSKCSTKGQGTNKGFCSTYVPKPDGKMNRLCSITDETQRPSGATKGNCSVLVDLDNIVCSTVGGGSDGGKENPSCSVGLSQPGTGSQCSVVNVKRMATCSTNKGQHQNCSAGMAGPGETLECSVTGGSDSVQFCSVSSQPPAGGHVHNNKCSVTNGDGGSHGTSTQRCSVMNHDAAKPQVCSVLKGQETNAVCTIVNKPGHGGGTPKCSAFKADGSDFPDQKVCSVVTLGPPPSAEKTGDKCGDGGHHGH